MVKSKGEGKEEKFESLKTKVKPIKKEKVSKIAEMEEKKKRDVIRGGKRIPLVYAALIIVTGVVIVAILMFMGPSAPPSSTIPVKEGDIAQIRYTGNLQNGSVFDAGNFTFRVGAQEIIAGIDEAIIGMKIGETKTITLTPEKAYGYYDPDRVLDIPLVQELERTEETTTDLFKLTFEEDPVMDKLYWIEGMEWPIRVVGIDNQTVKMRHEPEDGMVFEMKDNLGNVYGTSQVSVVGEKITITSSPLKGSAVATVIGTGVITEINETHMRMDLNHEMAGETLTFEIYLINFISY